jgi:hypothetical protein
VGKNKITCRDHHREKADDEVALLPQQAVSCNQCWDLDPDPLILNYGSGSKYGSLLFIKDLKIFKKKVQNFII